MVHFAFLFVFIFPDRFRFLKKSFFQDFKKFKYLPSQAMNDTFNAENYSKKLKALKNLTFNGVFYVIISRFYIAQYQYSKKQKTIDVCLGNHRGYENEKGR